MFKLTELTLKLTARAVAYQTMRVHKTCLRIKMVASRIKSDGRSCHAQKENKSANKFGNATVLIAAGHGDAFCNNKCNYTHG